MNNHGVETRHGRVLFLQPMIFWRHGHNRGAYRARPSSATSQHPESDEPSAKIVRKKNVGAGIGATPTWGYCVCCYQDRRTSAKKVSRFRELNIT